VDDVARLEAMTGRDPRLAGRAWGQAPGFAGELRTGRSMDGAVHTAAAKQRRIGGVDDRVDVKRNDVALDDDHPDRH
jgi:hypothetical protein